ncbi:MAG: PHB depolymerase family esterase [Pseudobdellovibrionaceae bacterium]
MILNQKRAALLLALLISISWQAKADEAEKGTLFEETFSSDVGSRKYSIFVPENLKPGAGLLVALHGCFMSPKQMIEGTQLNHHAAQNGFVVIYPEQTYQDNPWKCWNWFDSENQRRETGEASLIVGMTKATTEKYKLDSQRVFLTGISAGGAMAANLLGCYSDVYAGGLLASGLEFAAAQTETEAHHAKNDGPDTDVRDVAGQAYKCSPERKTLLKVLVVHGKKDHYVNPINADRTFAVFNQLNSIIFLFNGGSQSEITETTSSVPVAEGKYPVEKTESSFRGHSFVKKFLVDRMGHGWSGGQSTTPFMEPKGIDASQVIVDEFFR